LGHSVVYRRVYTVIERYTINSMTVLTLH